MTDIDPDTIVPEDVYHVLLAAQEHPEIITEEIDREIIESLKIQSLREAGCQCEKPLLGAGPHCLLCDTVATIAT